MSKFLKNIFYLFIFFLPLQTSYIVREVFLNKEKWQYRTILFYFTDLLLIILFFLFILALKNKFSLLKIKKRGVSFFLLIILFLLFSFFSLFWSADKELAFYSFIKLSSAIALFFLIINIKINWKKLFLIILLSALLQSSLGIYQFLSQKTFSNSFLGLSNHKSSDLGVAVIETPEHRWLRAYGGFSHPNIFGGFLASALLLSLYFYSQRKIHTKKDLLFNIFILISLNIIFVGLLVSFSRGGWLAFIFGFFIFGFFVVKKKEWIIFLNLIKIFSLFLIIIISFYNLSPYLFKSRLGLIGRLETKSIAERIIYTTQAKNLIKDHFFWGVGLGNYTIANYQKIQKPQPVWFFQPVHNVYLLIFSELGLIGLILFLFIIIYLFFIFYKNKIFNLQNIIFFLVFLMLCLLMFFDHYLWSSHFGLLFFWLMAGLFSKVSQKENCVIK